MRNNKRSVTRMFIKGFVLSFFIVIMLLGAGILGYQAVIKLWMPTEQAGTSTGQAGVNGSFEAQSEADSLVTTEPTTTASLGMVTKNLIFCYDKKKGTIKKLVLGVFHSDKKQLTYITIPLTAKYTMSDSLYRKMILVEPSIPQVIRLSSMTKYFDGDTIFDYGTQIVSDLLGVKISFYTAIPVKLYDTMFTEQQSGAEHIEIFSEKFIETLDAINSEPELGSYLEDLYTQVESNLPLSDQLMLLDSYYATPLNNVTFEQLDGEEQNSGFIPDTDKVRQRFYELAAYE